MKERKRARQPRPSAAKPESLTVPRLIDERIVSLADWRGATLAEMRRLIRAADPQIVEELKWIKPGNLSGVPVWSHAGIVCTGEVYKHVVKLTFARGASLTDPAGLFNASLGGAMRRAIDLREGDALDAGAFQSLVQAAVAENLRRSGPPSRSRKKAVAKAPPVKPRPDAPVVLLSGGNPQIAKADGDAPVQAYIAAMPGWKSGLGRRLDALIVQQVPQVRKAVRWNSPFYGVAGQGWFLSFHVLTRYVKVTFFNGLALQPIPPGGTEKSKEARWLDIYEHDPLNEAEFASWVQQAAALPGWTP